MMPSKIVTCAAGMGLDIIAVTDHNSGGNVEAVQVAGKRAGITVIGGMEITTEEEVHLLAYFDRNEDLYSVEMAVQENLPGTNDPDAFGEQVFLDSDDQILGVSEKLLFGAASLGVEAVVDLVHRNNGMVFAAHADRDAFSIISQLGYIPVGLALDGIELVRVPEGISSGDGNRVIHGYPYLFSSDAHYTGDIGKRITLFRLERPCVAELLQAMEGKNGRSIVE